MHEGRAQAGTGPTQAIIGAKFGYVDPSLRHARLDGGTGFPAAVEAVNEESAKETGKREGREQNLWEHIRPAPRVSAGVSRAQRLVLPGWLRRWWRAIVAA
jgi:hypothetical protein